MRSIVAAVLLLPGCAVAAVFSADAERRFPDEGGHVVAEGLRIRYVEKGEGRAIVLLHGAYGGIEDWQATILDEVAARGRAVAFDRPGHGFSARPCETATPAVQARILREACREIGAERPVLVGFSWGGAVAAAWAAQWPDEVEGLVLLNAPTHAWGGAPAAVDVAARLPLLGPLLTSNLFSVVGPLVASGHMAEVFAPEPVPASFERSPVPLALRPYAFRHNADDMVLLDAALAVQSARYPDIRCPVVFVVGDGDRIVGPEYHSPRFVAQVPRTRRVVVPGAGHQLPYAHPAACVEALDLVLRGP